MILVGAVFEVWMPLAAVGGKSPTCSRAQWQHWQPGLFCVARTGSAVWDGWSALLSWGGRSLEGVLVHHEWKHLWKTGGFYDFKSSTSFWKWCCLWSPQHKLSVNKSAQSRKCSSHSRGGAQVGVQPGGLCSHSLSWCSGQAEKMPGLALLWWFVWKAMKSVQDSQDVS